MVIAVILTVLAAFGVLCALWTLFGFLVSGQRGAAMVYICGADSREEQIIRHYSWLRDLGLFHGPLVLVHHGITQEEKNRLLKCRQGIEICTVEELPSRLEQERNGLGRTGT
jgi:hypothetical protein